MIEIGNGLQIETITQPITGVFHHAHCPGIVVFPDGEILIVYYHAIIERDRHQTIYGVRKLAQMHTFSAPFLVSKDNPGRMEGNPVIWIAPDTSFLWLFYVSSIGGWSEANLRYKISRDRGQTWTKYKKIYRGISRMVKNPPIITTKGWYLLPAYVEFLDYTPMFYFSQNQGHTWQDMGARITIKTDFVPSGKKNAHLIMQPTVIERSDGSFFCLNRAVSPMGKMYESESNDGGITWSNAIPGVLPNPNGGFAMQKLQSGRVAIVYNHAPAPPENIFERNPVSIALSEDDGRTWSYRRNLCEYHSDTSIDQKENRPSFGDPSLSQDQDGRIHIVWSFTRTVTRDGKSMSFTDIQYTSCTEDWILSDIENRF